MLLKQKNSLPLPKWQMVSASFILLLIGIGIGKYESHQTGTPTIVETKVKPISVTTTQIELTKTYQTL